MQLSSLFFFSLVFASCAAIQQPLIANAHRIKTAEKKYTKALGESKRPKRNIKAAMTKQMLVTGF